MGAFNLLRKGKEQAYNALDFRKWSRCSQVNFDFRVIESFAIHVCSCSIVSATFPSAWPRVVGSRSGEENADLVPDDGRSRARDPIEGGPASRVGAA